MRWQLVLHGGDNECGDGREGEEKERREETKVGRREHSASKGGWDLARVWGTLTLTEVGRMLRGWGRDRCAQHAREGEGGAARRESKRRERATCDGVWYRKASSDGDRGLRHREERREERRRGTGSGAERERDE